MSVFRKRGRLGVTVAVAAATVVALGGCSASSATSPTAAKVTSLHVAQVAGGALSDCLTDLATSYKAETGITVTVDTLPYASLHDKYLANFTAGSSDYDLLESAFQWTGEFAAPGFLADLGPLATSSDDLSGLSPSTVNSYKFDGKQYGIPYFGDSFLLFYRTDILKKIGAPAPKTWAEVEDISKKIKADPNLAGISPQAVMGDRTQGLATWANRYYGLGGGTLEDSAGKVTIDPQIAAAALVQLKSDITEYSPGGALTATTADTPAQFLSGNVAMLEMFAAGVTSSFSTKGADNKIAGKWSVTSIPGGSGDLGGWGLLVPSASTKQKAAYDFALYVDSPANDKSCLAKDGKLPVNTSVFSDASSTAVVSYLPQLGAALTNSRPRFTGKNAGTENDIVDQYVSQYTSGQIASATDAAAQMIAALEAANI